MSHLVVKLEDNRELVQDQALKHEDRSVLKYQSNVLVKNIETISVELTTIFTSKTEHSMS